MQSLLAPTSRRRDAEFILDIHIASAGLSTSSSPPMTSLAVAITAPVLPAETSALASPLFTASAAILNELLFFFLIGAIAESSIVITSSAFKIGRRLSAFNLTSCCFNFSSCPTRSVCTPYFLKASTAPITSAVGALSPPIASSAIFTSISVKLAFFYSYHFLTVVVATRRAYTVRKVKFMAFGAFHSINFL